MCNCGTKIIQLGGGGPAVNIYNTNGTLTGPRTVNMAGNDLTFQGGGNFIIDGKLTVTGIIDPTGLQFTSGVQSDAAMPNGTTYVTNGTLSGFPSGEMIFKDFAGVYQRLQNPVTSGNYATSDLTATGNRIHTWGTFNQNENFTTGAAQREYLLAGVSRLRVQEAANSFIALTNDLVSGDQGRLFASITDTGMLCGTSGGTNVVRVKPATIGMDFGTASDLQINSSAGIAGQVLTSSGPALPPTWTTSANPNIYNADGVLTGNRSLTGANTFSLNMSGITGFSTTALGSNSLTSISGTQLSTALVQPLLAELRSQAVAGGSTVQSKVSVIGGQGINFNLPTTDDFRINGNSGTAGQVLTSGGINVPPVWATGAAVNIYNANGTLTANRTVTLNGKSLDLTDTDLTSSQSLAGGLLFQINPSANGDFYSLQVDPVNKSAALGVSDGVTGEIASVQADTTAAALYHNSTGKSCFVQAAATGVALRFLGASDLRINTSPGKAGQVVTSQGTGVTPAWSVPGVLATSLPVSLTVVGATSVYTVPALEQVVITGIDVIIDISVSMVTPPTLGFGFNGTEDNIYAPTSLVGVLLTGDVWSFKTVGKSLLIPAGSSLKLGVDVAGVGSGMFAKIVVHGYIV